MSTLASPLNDQEFLALTSVLQRAPLLRGLGLPPMIAAMLPTALAGS